MYRRYRSGIGRCRLGSLPSRLLGSEVARGLNAQHRVGQTVEQRAVEGDAVGVKERGELRDGALVRGVFPRAAGCFPASARIRASSIGKDCSAWQAGR